MKIKKLLAVGAVAAATVATLRIAQRYNTWKQEEVARLQSNSSLIETALGTVEYKMIGQGPAVLVAHGSPGGYDQGIAFARLIGSDQCTFISASRPGYLRTPLTSGRTPEEQADLYAALLDALHIERAAIIAISGGGPSSLQFALRHADRCTGLVMVSAVSQHYSEAETYQALPLGRRVFKQINDKLTIFDPLIYLIITLAKIRPDQFTPQDLLDSITMFQLRKVGFENDMKLFDVLTPYPLQQITVPTFILHGTEDMDVPLASAELLAREVSGAKLLPIEGGGHLSFILEKERVMPALREFLLGLPSSSAAKKA